MIGFIFFVSSKATFGIEPNQDCQNILGIYEDIRNQTILSFSHHEKSKIRSINIHAVVHANFSRAGAYINRIDNSRHIVFSCTHMALIGQAANAMAYLAILKEPDKTEAVLAIEGYLRYLIHSVSFKKKLMSYPEFVGFKLPKNEQKHFEQIAFGFRYQMAASVLFHEFGHHVLNHLNSSASKSSFSRDREQEADKWSIRAMLKNSMLPMVSAVLFKMLNELNRSDLRDEWKLSHPASTKRAIYYFKNGMDAFKDPLIIRAFNETQSKTGITLGIAKSRTKAMLEDFKRILKEEQYKSDNPFLYWSTKAKNLDTQGVIEMGYIYSGKYEVKRDLLKSRKHFCLAAKLEDRDYSYDYVSKAIAHYLCGHAYGFWDGEGVNRNIDKAKYHLNKSADMGYISAQVALNYLKE